MHVIPAQAGIHFSRQGALRYDIDATLGSLPPAAKALKKIRLPGAALGTVLWPKDVTADRGQAPRQEYLHFFGRGRTYRQECLCQQWNSHSWLFSRGTATPGCSPVEQPLLAVLPNARPSLLEICRPIHALNSPLTHDARPTFAFAVTAIAQGEIKPKLAA